MVQYQGEQIQVQPFTLVCKNFHHQLYYLPEHWNSKEFFVKCQVCNEQCIYYLVNVTSGRFLRLISDPKLQKIEDEIVKDAKDNLKKMAQDELERQLASKELERQQQEELEQQDKDAKEKKEQEEKDKLIKIKQEAEKEARAIRKRLKELEKQKAELQE